MTKLNLVVANLNIVLKAINSELSQSEPTEFTPITEHKSNILANSGSCKFKGNITTKTDPKSFCEISITTGALALEICEERDVILTDPTAFGFGSVPITEEELNALLKTSLVKLTYDKLVNVDFTTILASLDATTDSQYNYQHASVGGVSRFIIIGDKEIVIAIACAQLKEN